MSNRQRRAAKAKTRVKANARRASPPPGGKRFHSMFTPSDEARALLRRAADDFGGGNAVDANEAMRALATIDPHVVERESEAGLLSVVGALWQHGWQPAELIRLARRTDARVGLLAVTAVAADHAHRAPSTLSPAWAEQIRELALPQIQSNTGWVSVVAAREGLDRLGLISLVVRLLAMLGAAGPLPTIIRPPGAQPDDYHDIKSLLLQRVAHHSRCKSVYHPRYGMSSIVGFASDVAATEAVFTSLLVQSHAALRSEAAKAPPGSRARSRSFRSSFILSFVARIDERLREVTAHVESVASSMQGAALLPVLVERENAVEDSVTELFGTLEGVAVRGGTDAAGWARGRIAADQADLHAGDVAAPFKRLGGAA